MALRSFYRWLSEEYRCPNPMASVPAPKAPQPVIEPLSREEVAAILVACDSTRTAATRGRAAFAMRRDTALRDRAIVLVLLDAGLRAGELCALTVGDVDLGSGRVLVRSGKGGKGRVVYLGRMARRAVWKYLAGRRQPKPHEPLFLAREGRPLTPDRLAKLFANLGARAGVANLHPHRLRHTFGTLTALFAAEFAGRFLASGNRRGYVRAHLVDLIALVPSVRGLRILRLLRLLRLVRAFAGVARALSTMQQLARHRGLIQLLLAWIAVVVLTSIGLYASEHGVNGAVNEPLDALWWGIVTMTTVGYGDVYPVTPEGRLAASVLVILGIGLFSAVTATITSFLLDSRGLDSRGTSDHPLDVLVDALERIGRLRDNGYLTEDQFSRAREALLARLDAAIHGTTMNAAIAADARSLRR